jgi:hypothetical protein
MYVRTLKETVEEAVALVVAALNRSGRAGDIERTPESVIEEAGIDQRNLRHCYSGRDSFPDAVRDWLLRRIADTVVRERLRDQFATRKAIRWTGRVANRLLVPAGPQAVHGILLHDDRTKDGRALAAAHAFHAMETSEVFARRYHGALLSLKWAHVPELVALLVDEARRADGEAEAYVNASLLFKAMKIVPVATTEDCMGALELSYVLGDLAAQFDDWVLVKFVEDSLRELRSEIDSDDARILCKRMTNEYRSLRRNVGTFEERINAARAACSQFDKAMKRYSYFTDDFRRLHEGWLSTIFNFIQLAIPRTQSEAGLAGQHSLFDRHLERMGMPSTMKSDADTVTASDPWRAQLIARQFVSLAPHLPAVKGGAYVDRAIQLTGLALVRFGRPFAHCETIMAQLHVDRAAALLRTYTRVGGWRLSTEYVAARAAADAYCEAACVSHKMSRLNSIEKAVGYIPEK